MRSGDEIVVSVVFSQLHWLACSGRVTLIASFLDHGASPDAAVRTFLFHSTVYRHQLYIHTYVCMALCLVMFTYEYRTHRDRPRCTLRVRMVMSRYVCILQQVQYRFY